MYRILAEQKAKEKALLEKQRQDELRVQKFNEERERRNRERKRERSEKINKTLQTAHGGEEKRLKEIEEAAKKAEQNRKEFMAKKKEEERVRVLSHILFCLKQPENYRNKRVLSPSLSTHTIFF